MGQEKLNNITYLRAIYNDVDQLFAAANNWSLDFKQLDSGTFEGELIMLDSNTLQLTYSQFSRQFEQHASTPRGYRTFSIPGDHKQSFTWRGHAINGNNLLIVPKSGEVEAVSNPDFKLFTISIAEKLIEEYFEIQKYEKSKILDPGIEVLSLPKQVMDVLRIQIHKLFAQFGQQPQFNYNKSFLKNIEEEFIRNLFSHIVQDNLIVSLPPKRIRDIALRRALDCIHSNCLDWPSVSELCIVSGASQRTLEYAFKEKYGFGPKEYMTKIRLNNVHKILKESNPLHTKIRDIAQENGFFHMGQFGTDYKKLFGELPSKTIGLKE